MRPFNHYREQEIQDHLKSLEKKTASDLRNVDDGYVERPGRRRRRPFGVYSEKELARFDGREFDAATGPGPVAIFSGRSPDGGWRV
jgi:hypothetical protein